MKKHKLLIVKAKIWIKFKIAYKMLNRQLQVRTLSLLILKTAPKMDKIRIKIIYRMMEKFRTITRMKFQKITHPN